jgi:hypothetical protein
MQLGPEINTNRNTAFAQYSLPRGERGLDKNFELLGIVTLKLSLKRKVQPAVKGQGRSTVMAILFL